MFILKKIEKERIANPNDIPLLDNWECQIDNMIPFEPVMCVKCQTIFCKDCINSWKLTSNKCPLRCDPFKGTDLKTSPLFKHQLDNIWIKCIFETHGCVQSLSIDSLTAHQKHCEYRIIICNKCNTEIPYINKVTHLFSKCIGNQIKCPLCSEGWNLSSIAKHLKMCITLNEGSGKLKSLATIETCKECGLKFIKGNSTGFTGEAHCCLKKDLISDVGKLINFVSVTKEYLERVNEWSNTIEMEKNLLLADIEGAFSDIIDAIKEREDNDIMNKSRDGNYWKSSETNNHWKMGEIEGDLNRVYEEIMKHKVLLTHN